MRAPTRVERLLALVLGLLGLAWAADTGVRALYLAPRDELRDEIASAELAARRAQRLEARAEEIRRAYEALQQNEESPRSVLRSRSDILLEVEELAGDGMRLHALDPRPGTVGGRPTLHLSIEASSELEDLGQFLLQAIDDLGGVVTSMTITPEVSEPGARTIRSRVELDVVYDGS